MNQPDIHLCARLEELSELLQKREQLRMVYRDLKPDAAHCNIGLLLLDIERAAAILDRRIAITRSCLFMGLIGGERNVRSA
jgi:hypothetical protein